jgi:hypothetical protein
MEKVYIFLHTGCIHESDYKTVSIHKTKKGAYRAMNSYLNREFEKSRIFKYLYGKEFMKDHLFIHQGWKVKQWKIEP